MNTIYLSSIEISDFRAFGPNFTFSPPPGPSISIIYGMNGLGKTTFFEAMEWGLTGDVRRLSSQVRSGQLNRYLTRRGASDQSHRVALTYTDNQTPIVRTAVTVPTAKQLVSRFKLPSWRPTIEDIAPYFRLTMLLPQSRKLRFEEEDGDKKWKLLEGPAGVQRLEQIRQALGSTKTINAFKKSISEASVLVDNRTEKLERWNELLTGRAKILSRCGTGTQISAEQAITYIEGLVDTIAAVTGKPVGKTPIGTEEIVPFFEELRTIVVLNSEAIETRRVTLASCEQLIEEYGRDLVAIKHLQGVIKEASAELKDKRDAVALVNEELKSFELELKRNESALASEAGRLTSVRQLRQAIVDKAGLEVEIERIRRQRDELGTQILSLNKTIEQTQLKIQRDSDMQEKMISLLAEIEAMDAELISLIGWEKQTLRKPSLSIQLESLKSSRQLIEDENEVKSEERIPLAGEIERLSDQLRIELERADRLGRSVADVVELINEEMNDCPVCATHFDPGKLKEAANDSLARRGVGNRSISDAISTKSAQLKELDVLLKALSDQLSANGKSQIVLQDSLREAEVAESDMERLCVRRGLDKESATSLLTEQIRVKKEELEALKASREVLDQSVASTLQANEQAMRQYLVQSNALDEQLRTLGDRLEEVEGVFSVYAGPPVDKTNLESIEESIGLLISAFEKLSQLFEESKLLADKKQAERDLLREEIERLALLEESQQAKLNQHQERSQGLLSRWERMGFDSVPSMSALADSRSDSEGKIVQVAQIQRELDRLIEGYNSWLASSELVEHDKVMLEFAGRLLDKIEYAEVTSGLQKLVEDAKAEHDRRVAASAKAKAMAETLGDRASDFSERALKPLENRIQQFHDVLSPFRYSIKLQTRSRATNSRRLEETVSYKDLNGQVSTLPPFAELSDGQLAVQGLSTLLAASVEYSWCRWPALLLDDPLQSSDLIHASAFIDIIRGLVKDNGYQIFLSSHDMDEAEFIARKCEKSNIEVGRCHLLGPGTNGVRYENSR